MGRSRWIIAAAAVAAVILFFFFGLNRYFTLASLKANREALLRLYQARPFATAAGFIAVYVVVTALSLPGAAVLSLAAGAIFGVLAGTVYAVTAATTGAAAAFLLARHLFHDFVQRRFGSRIDRLNRELESKGLPYLLFLRLVPVFPFFLVNIAAAVTRLPLRTYLLGTLLGIIPGGAVYVNAGASLGSIERTGDIASPRVLASLSLLGVFALVPVVYSKARKKGEG